MNKKPPIPTRSDLINIAKTAIEMYNQQVVEKYNKIINNEIRKTRDIHLKRQLVKDKLKPLKFKDIWAPRQGKANQVFKVITKNNNTTLFVRLRPIIKGDWLQYSDIQGIMDELGIFSIGFSVEINYPDKKDDFPFQVLVCETVDKFSLKELLNHDKIRITKEELKDIIKKAYEKAKRISNKNINGFGWLKFSRPSEGYIIKDYEGQERTELSDVEKQFNSLMKELTDWGGVKRKYFKRLKSEFNKKKKELFNLRNSKRVYYDLNTGNIMIKLIDKLKDYQFDDLKKVINKKKRFTFNDLIDFDLWIGGDQVRVLTLLVFEASKNKLLRDVMEEVIKLNDYQREKLRFFVILWLLIQFSKIRRGVIRDKVEIKLMKELFKKQVEHFNDKKIFFYINDEETREERIIKETNLSVINELEGLNSETT